MRLAVSPTSTVNPDSDDEVYLYIVVNPPIDKRLRVVFSDQAGI